MSLELDQQTIGWIVQAGVVALVGFLLKISINNVADLIRDIKAKLSALDATDREQGRDILELKIQVKYLNEELRETKDLIARESDRHDEFGRFLQRMGFKRSDRDKEESST